MSTGRDIAGRRSSRRSARRSRDPETLERLIEAGADVFRLNFSHGTRDDHAENVERIREAAEPTGKWVGVLGDLPGPKLRLDDVEGGVVTVSRSATSSTLTTDEPTRQSQERAAGRLGRT